VAAALVVGFGIFASVHVMLGGDEKKVMEEMELHRLTMSTSRRHSNDSQTRLSQPGGFTPLTGGVSSSASKEIHAPIRDVGTGQVPKVVPQERWLKEEAINVAALTQRHKLAPNESPAIVSPECGSRSPVDVEIWGKAAIADYLWEHVLRADVTLAKSRNAPQTKEYDVGVKTLQLIQPSTDRLPFLGLPPCVRLTFRRGVRSRWNPLTVAGVASAKHVVLVVNAHEPKKVATAWNWVKLLRTMPQLVSSGLVVLGASEMTILECALIAHNQLGRAGPRWCLFAV
jgi:hypothetical protein